MLREVFSNVSDYADAANKFVASLSSSWSMQDAKNLSIPVFTSDWAFYWFDYLAGYDTILAELEVNHSRTQQIALCRGAARAQGKDWGAIITWTYNDPPYMDTGPEMLDDRLTAFRAGAKYVIVFNYPRVNEYGALREEQFLGYAAVLEPHSRFPEKHFWNNRWRGCFCAAQELWVRHELAR